MSEKDSGPAFNNMTLRDYFAAQWLLGAALEWARSAPEKLAEHAYEIADAMLKEREK